MNLTALKGKNVFITGASSGIGAASAKQFAAIGANLILTARRVDRIDALAAECQQQYDIKTHCIGLDVTERADVASAIEQLPNAFTNIDVLLNNAGLAAGMGPVQSGDLDDWECMIDTNIKGLLYVTRAILPKMIAANHGHIINVGSIAGREVYPNGNVYCATKHAVTALSRSMIIDLNETNVRVTCIDPGMVETEFSVVRFQGDQKKADKIYQGMTPLTPDDIADSIIFAATRPAHVNIADMLILPTDQASPTIVHRK